MRCVAPLDGWLAARPNDNGLYPVVFGLREGDAQRPVSVPCGKCLGCLKDRAEGWALRCHHESLGHERNCFVTLTYADPAPDKISKRDLQLFFKRLRKHGYRFRYFACGEYGSRTLRPHYHVLFFGEDFTAGSEQVFQSQTYYHPELESIWGHGHIQLGRLESGACFYTAGYMLKNAGTDAFQLSSRRPGIGYAWLRQFWEDLVRNNFLTLEGRKFSIPARYLDCVKLKQELEPLKDRRKEYARTAGLVKLSQGKLDARSREIHYSQQAERRGSL